MDLSKKDKRLCRELIYTSLEKECAKFVNDLHQAAEKPIPLAELNAPYREVNGQKVAHPIYLGENFLILQKIYTFVS